jgi:hypothetical protein
MSDTGGQSAKRSQSLLLDQRFARGVSLAGARFNFGGQLYTQL